ncbi:hypothetical protein Ancab_022857 [Ancistrocladus abbreviatus]
MISQVLASSRLQATSSCGFNVLVPNAHSSIYRSSNNTKIAKLLQLASIMSIRITSATTSSKTESFGHGKTRRSGDFPPSIWSSKQFLTNHDVHIVDPSMQQQHDKLKGEIKRMLLTKVPSSIHLLDKLRMIDSVQRLGIAYHFESEIQHVLCQLHQHLNYIDDGIFTDLYSTALLFRLMREFGFNVSSEKSLSSVFRRLLSITLDKECFISEMGFWGNWRWCWDLKRRRELFETEQVRAQELLVKLKEAKIMAETGDCRRWVHEKGVRYSVRSAYQVLNGRIDSTSKDNILKHTYMEYKSSYEGVYFCLAIDAKQNSHGGKSNEKRRYGLSASTGGESCTDLLVLYKQGVLSGSSGIWCKVIWSVAYGARRILGCQKKPDQKWGYRHLWRGVELGLDVESINALPGFMKLIVHALLDLFSEVESKAKRRPYVIHYLKQEFKKLARAYLVEAKWICEGHVPTVEEYMDVAITTAGSSFIPAVLFAGMEDATEDSFHWACSVPKIGEASAIITRLLNDSVCEKYEQHQSAKAIKCYMKEMKITEEEAKAILENQVENAWKDINQELLLLLGAQSNSLPKPVIMCFVNLARAVDISIHNDRNAYIHSHITKPTVSSLFVHPMST